MLSFNMCEGPKKIWHHFGLFLSLFLAFHLKFLQLCKKPPSYISGTHQSLFPLVNNSQNWCQKLCTFFSPLLILQGECVTSSPHLLVVKCSKQIWSDVPWCLRWAWRPSPCPRCCWCPPSPATWAPSGRAESASFWWERRRSDLIWNILTIVESDGKYLLEIRISVIGYRLWVKVRRKRIYQFYKAQIYSVATKQSHESAGAHCIVS